MKLSKQQETEIIRAYKVYFDSYINGDVKSIASLLDDGYNQIGSAGTEVFYSKEDAIKFLHDTIDQVAGKTEMRNRFIKVDPLQELILITDLFDIYALMDSEWSFYAKFRASTLMQKKEDGWKFIHQHSSMPDTRTDEGDNIAIEKVNAENLQLREAVKRRTVELEAKTNELKIEASLERIRTIAMSMQKADGLLEVVEILYKELKTLGFTDIRNTIINIFNDTKEIFLNYDYSDYGVGGISEVDYNSHPSNKEFVNKMREASNEFMITEFTGNELDEWRKWRSDQGQMPDSKLDQAESLYYYEFSIGVGSIGISTFSPVNADQLKILNKIRNVFDLAYGRYAEIAQAEAHAREAKIEAALERVRTRSMAMHKSEELAETAMVMFEQLCSLGQVPDRLGIVIYNEQQQIFENWITDQSGKQLTKAFKSSIKESTTFAKIYKGWKEKKDSIVIDLSGEELKSWLQFVKGNMKMFINESKIKNRRVHYAAFFSHGSLMCTFHNPPKNNFIQLLVRFAKVFNQTYTRFLDLQKAEAQAREGQIELALERVRARAMSMQKSEELSDLVNTVFTELTKLDFALSWCIINIIDEPNKSNVVWGANTDAGKPPDSYFMKFEDHRFHHEMMKAYQDRKGKWVFVLEGNEKRNYDNYLFSDTEFRKVSKKVQQEMRSTERYVTSFTFCDFGGLQTIGEEPLSEESLNILNRFGKVFDLTYTRFNDLQKAEAQAREAQVEAALERVRSRSLAMHKSEELADLSMELVKQVQALGIDTWFCAFNIDDDDPQGSLEWGSNGEGTFPKYRTPREGIFLRYYEAGQRGETLLINEIDENECPSHYNYLCSLPGVGEQLLKMKDAGIPFPTSQIDHVAYFKYGYILFITFEPASEAHDIFKRFAKVFEQTYTRFLDLQKAEAQAREAQIEVAVERVRASALAMHKSEEILEVAVMLKKQMDALELEGVSAATIFLKQDNGNIRVWDLTEIIRTEKGLSLTADFEFRLKDTDPELWVRRAWRARKKFFMVEMDAEDGDYERCESWLREHDRDLADGYHDFITTNNPQHSWHPGVQLEYGKLTLDFVMSPPEEISSILSKMGAAFDLAYRRFLDLQKSEERTREAQIEAALEKVRSRSIGMQQSDELKEVIQVIHDQLILLGFEIEAAGFTLDYKQTNDWSIWFANKEQSLPTEVFVPYTDHPQFHFYKDAKEKGLDFLANTLSFEEKNSLFEYMFNYMGDYPQAEKDEILSAPGLAISQVFMKNVTLWVDNYEGVPFSQEENSVLKRFAKVFDQTYVRFNDLKRAEAQAREAQIELSLERIRAQVTAMKESSDLLDIVVTMNAEFKALGHEAHYFWHMRWLPDTYEKAMTSGDGSRIGMVMELPRGFHENTAMLEWEKNDEPVGIFAFDIEGAIDYVDKMIRLGRFSEIDHNAPGPDDIRAMGGLTFVMARTTHGEIGYTLPGVVTGPPVEDIAALVRFAGVFDLAYRRFEDLKSAEQQNRETQIELALERVRAKTMAMHNSEDMGNTVLTLFHEVLKLGLDNDIRCGIGILEGTELMETRSATLDPNGEVDLKMGMLDMTIHPMLIRIKKAWKSGGTRFTDQMTGKDVIRYYTALNNEPDYPFFVELDTLPKIEFHNSFSFSEGILFAFSPNPMSEEAAKVLERFARVFGQTYRRFRDLQKAEAQTREAKIEASLERIRSQAMAMQHSDDLVKSTAILFEEFEKLELSVDRCGIGIFDKETRDCHLWSTVTTHDGKTELATGITSLTVHPMLIETFEAWKSQRSLQYILEGKELEDYYRLVSKSEFHLPSKAIENSASLPKEYYLYTPFGAGGLYAFSATEPAKEEKNIIRRFAEVFHLTYTRYEDLQKAEARALEAVKQASLDRVRGEIASMRTTDDLQRITPLIWSELEILEVPLIRCGVFIIDESRSNVKAFLTTPDGKPIGALNLSFDATELTYNTVEHWRKKKVYTHHWNKEDFVNWMQSMISLGQIQIPKQYQGYAKPPESLDLHFIPFKQGMLYVGNTEPLLPEKIELVNTLAKAFSIAYSRYEDFVNLENAKTRVEKTLSELKSAQTQLIHSEKMASLGELTAGIAHEIQNPLNFVNNFSEVSVDLIEEMDDEMTLGNIKEVKDIAGDLKQNLEKIHHHGKRASFIVQGMLEHSRSNPGDKKPTNINVLADEFLRLSYHGLRAKDKSFNAKIITKFEKDLPEINVIPQDFGRVLLNLVNNAFYAVAERQRIHKKAYKPSVTVSTRKINNKMEIRVKDNGNGIPNEVLKKIFQPFFTTKPTGEGTGLGLSMSYDIITKGHNGKLEVETKEGEGTTFIINIPIKS